MTTTGCPSDPPITEETGGDEETETAGEESEGGSEPMPTTGPEPLVDVPGKNGEGLWGLFRLLDTAASVTDQGSGARATWVMDAGASRIRVTLELEGTTVNHPFKRGFMRLSPPSAP